MPKTSRRKILIGSLGLLSVGTVTAWVKKNSILRWAVRQNSNNGLALSAAPTLTDNVCVLTSEQTEGPFFISSPLRSDIVEGRSGKPMSLKMQILRMPDCQPIENALVEIWHCDAEGIYSGYPEGIAHDLWKTLQLLGPSAGHVPPLNETRFLRGALRTDSVGQVEFQTIFPGWYEPRAPHIHFKVLVGEDEQLTSQFYFDPDFCNQIYRELQPYKGWGECPYTPHNDVVVSDYLEAEGLQLQVAWNQQGPLQASARVGIEKSSKS